MPGVSVTELAVDVRPKRHVCGTRTEALETNAEVVKIRWLERD